MAPSATKQAQTVTDSEPVVEPPVPARLHTFELDDAELSLVLSSRAGRAAKPSEFLEDVRNGIKSGKPLGIPVTGTRKGAYIMGQLRKAEKQLKATGEMPEGSTLQKWNREDSVNRPFVGFQYKPPTSEDATAAASSAA